MSGTEKPAVQSSGANRPGALSGIRVVELADEQAEYCGLTLAGLGAEVIKIEPPTGNPTREIGPFYEDKKDRERSLFFWQYNRGKRSVALDLEQAGDAQKFATLLDSADVLLESTPKGQLEALGFGGQALRERFPALIQARVTPFGDEGPWSHFQGSDLIHLALGGVMMNCGYDPMPNGEYDLPPIAPQMWHAYHIAGEQLSMAILAALLFRQRTGQGQQVSCAIHEAVAKCTEVDLMSWVMRRSPVLRQTCRHARETISPHPTIAHTKDGRWVMASLGTRPGDGERLIKLLDKYGIESGLEPQKAAEPTGSRFVPGTAPNQAKRDPAMEAVQRFVRSFTYENVPWREAQEAGMLWAPLRKPHENALDPHWLARGSCTDVHHPELGESFRYATSKWIGTATGWTAGRRAPLLNEDAHAIDKPASNTAPTVNADASLTHAGEVSRRGKPFALDGIRILDFTWFLASAGGTRFMSAFGAESLKVEIRSHPDTRMASMAPVGGRAARENATSPLPGVTDPDMGGQFNNKNPGKRGISLNVRHPKGLEIARRLVAISDIVAEGFSPGVLDNWGLGYDALRAIKPNIIYVQQSGMGAQGKYGRFRTVGPVANSFAGLSEMSGLPEPAMPAGWGYSYLDWMGAYSFALAMLSALFHRDRTGEGQWIDASQSEVGLFINGTTMLDWSANDRIWTRTGNRSPHKIAAPHGVYACEGDDRWLAIACFDESQWRALANLAERPQWITDPRFTNLTSRAAHQDALDDVVGQWTKNGNAERLMMALQKAGVPAGVCQSAEDRCDNDPQLAALEWLTEVTGTKIGRWPVAEVPIKLSESPAYAGGRIDRGAPCYGEDNEYVYGELLGMSTKEIADLTTDGVL
ncbi:MAG: crotonobetainyl-CoA:carnitine CoA-transferase CaiB-like acyl-CoA transferase [Gammaproteobacteria bacterium]|jgi:crotonobetainyl-CoA:carnitine CoA-transferase CaiB-like acyl-CoA transferase